MYLCIQYEPLHYRNISELDYFSLINPLIQYCQILILISNERFSVDISLSCASKQKIRKPYLYLHFDMKIKTNMNFGNAARIKDLLKKVKPYSALFYSSIIISHFIDLE